jgi:hypothetical protein
MFVAICSAKGSPGVSVAALALASMWPARVVLAECDPAGSDLRTGFLRGEVDTGGRGIGRLAAAARRSEVTDLRPALAEQLWTLNPEGTLLWLPGVEDPAQANLAAGSWGRLGQTFAALENADPIACNLIADCGRLAAPAPVHGLLASADLVLLAVRPTVTSVASAGIWMPQLRRHVPESRRLQLLLLGAGPFAASEVSAALDCRLAGQLPHDESAAAVLTGVAPAGRGFSRSPLMRAADSLAGDLVSRVHDARRAQLPISDAAPRAAVAS